MPFEFIRNLTRRFAPGAALELGDRQLPLVLIRNPRARRYVLRLQADGAARVTIPRGGSASAAREFAERNKPWLTQALQRLAARPKLVRHWTVGTAVWFRGESLAIEAVPDAAGKAVRLGPEIVRVPDGSADLRPALEQHLWQLAAKELPPRVQAYAATHHLEVRRITVRSQRSRWGSCSRRKTISLNWRLIQTPVRVQDYIILHELMHLRQMNHSARFWQEVRAVCPAYETAEHWLKQHAALLR